MTAPRRAGERNPANDDEMGGKFMGFLDHLEELRRRLIRIMIILAAGTAVTLFFTDELISILTRLFPASDGGNLALLHPTEGFSVRLKVAFVAGLFLTAPLVFWQIWGFVAPGLYPQERKMILPVITAFSLMFAAGAGFGYWMLPYAVTYFQKLTVAGVAVNWSLGKFVDFTLQILLAFGILFELPLFIYTAAALGLVTPAFLRKNRRYAIVLVLIIAAVLTPPDAFTQIILAMPLYLLYEAGILAAVVANKRRHRRLAHAGVQV